MSDPQGTLPASEHLDAEAEALLERHWRHPGFAVPNEAVYPHQWLWDSCFHAVVWAHLGRGEQAVSELTNLFARQGPDGFVAHMNYWEPTPEAEQFWGRPATSCITQPPMYGHAIAELARRSVTVPDALVRCATDALVHLLDRRPRPDSLVPVLHPWETGCDDSPRWDGWCGGGWDPLRWKQRKGELVASLRFDEGSGGRAGRCGPTGNPSFLVGSAAFSALVAFNAAELASLTGDATLLAGHDEIAAALERLHDPVRCTWLDDPGSSSPPRTLEALLPALVAPPAVVLEVLEEVCDDTAFGGAFGPAQVHRDEPAYQPDRYWRGAAWPQLTYLLWVAAVRVDADEAARSLAQRLVRGAVTSGFAEHWQPDSGAPGGARPQSWSTLAAVVQAPRR